MRSLRITLATLCATCVGALAAVCAYLHYDSRAEEHLRDLAKPFAAWFLGAGFVVKGVRFAAVRGYALQMALVFALYGAADIAMEFGARTLALGVTLFLVGHAVYTRALVQAWALPCEADAAPQGSVRARRAAAVAVALVFGAVTANSMHIIVRRTHSAVLAVLSAAYPLTFAAMAVCAVLYWRRAVAAVLTVLGALVYAASDTVVAVQRFVAHRPWMDLFIMVSYWLAIFLLACAAFPVVWHATNHHSLLFSPRKPSLPKATDAAAASAGAADAASVPSEAKQGKKEKASKASKAERK